MQRDWVSELVLGFLALNRCNSREINQLAETEDKIRRHSPPGTMMEERKMLFVLFDLESTGCNTV